MTTHKTGANSAVDLIAKLATQSNESLLIQKPADLLCRVLGPNVGAVDVFPTPLSRLFDELLGPRTKCRWVTIFFDLQEYFGLSGKDLRYWSALSIPNADVVQQQLTDASRKITPQVTEILFPTLRAKEINNSAKGVSDPHIAQRARAFASSPWIYLTGDSYTINPHAKASIDSRGVGVFFRQNSELKLIYAERLATGNGHLTNSFDGPLHEFLSDFLSPSFTAQQQRTAFEAFCELMGGKNPEFGKLDCDAYLTMPINIDGRFCSVSIALDMQDKQAAREKGADRSVTLRDANDIFAIIASLRPFFTSVAAVMFGRMLPRLAPNLHRRVVENIVFTSLSHDLGHYQFLRAHVLKTRLESSIGRDAATAINEELKDLLDCYVDSKGLDSIFDTDEPVNKSEQATLTCGEVRLKALNFASRAFPSKVIHYATDNCQKEVPYVAWVVIKNLVQNALKQDGNEDVDVAVEGKKDDLVVTVSSAQPFPADAAKLYFPSGSIEYKAPPREHRGLWICSYIVEKVLKGTLCLRSPVAGEKWQTQLSFQIRALDNSR